MTVAAALTFFGMFLGEPGAAADQVAVIEVPFSTGAGDGASGLRRFFRSGCYEVVSEGGPGAAKSRDSQAGCHLPGEVSEAFERLDVLASASGGAIIQEGKKESNVPSSSGGERPFGRSQARVVVVKGDGSRGVAVNDDVAGLLLAAVNSIPADNQWHAKLPAPPHGKGPQFVAIRISSTGGGVPKTFQASLSADGRWWCHRSAGTGVAPMPTSGKQRLAPIGGREAGARLGRILKGAKPKSPLDDDDDGKGVAGVETSVELVFAGRSRSALFPGRLASTVAKRFATEMTRHSPLCALP